MDFKIKIAHILLRRELEQEKLFVSFKLFFFRLLNSYHWLRTLFIQDFFLLDIFFFFFFSKNDEIYISIYTYLRLIRTKLEKFNTDFCWFLKWPDRKCVSAHKMNHFWYFFNFFILLDQIWKMISIYKSIDLRDDFENFWFSFYRSIKKWSYFKKKK